MGRGLDLRLAGAHRRPPRKKALRQAIGDLDQPTLQKSMKSCRPLRNIWSIERPIKMPQPSSASATSLPRRCAYREVNSLRRSLFRAGRKTPSAERLVEHQEFGDPAGVRSLEWMRRKRVSGSRAQQRMPLPTSASASLRPDSR